MRKFYTAFVVLLFSLSSFAQTLDTDFITYEIGGQVSSSIDTGSHSIDVKMPQGSDLTALVASFTLSTGATTSVNGVDQVSGTTVNDFSNGPLTYTVVNGDNTQDWTVTASIIDAIEELVALEVNVYPNPATDYVVVDNADFATVSVYNILGGLVETINSTQSELTIDLSGYSKGTYLIRVQKGNQMVTKKVSVVK